MPGTVATVGTFDGVHRGHQAVLAEIVRRARAGGRDSVVVTFDPHPRSVMHPESAPPLLQTLDQLLANLGVLSIEQAIVIKFDIEFASLPAEDFLRNIVRDRLHAREVYLGKGFAFGKDRGGDIGLLRSKSAELGFIADEVGQFQALHRFALGAGACSCTGAGFVLRNELFQLTAFGQDRDVGPQIVFELLLLKFQKCVDLAGKHG